VHGVRHAIEAAGATLLYLPAYAPDFKPPLAIPLSCASSIGVSAGWMADQGSKLPVSCFSYPSSAPR
jgi:hypothetical protein